MKIKIKKNHENAQIPKYESYGAACFDLTAVSKEMKLLKTGPVIEYDTGLSFEIPSGFVGLIFPRSSIATKTNTFLANCVGVIDSDYRGTVKAQFKKATAEAMLVDYNKGDRIMQMMILPVEQVQFQEVNELSKTERGSGGFGSTGK